LKQVYIFTFIIKNILRKKMKKNLIYLIFIVIISASFIHSQNKGFGLGIIVGEPTGVSFKYWTGSNSAFDGAVAWSFIDGGALHIHADYILHSFNLIPVGSGSLPFYYGIGARIKFLDDAGIGVRVAYLFSGTPIDIFLEIVPLLDLTPKTDFKINAAIGGRYFFN
jgi:hypothetical protein